MPLYTHSPAIWRDAADRIGCRVQIQSTAYEKDSFRLEDAICVLCSERADVRDLLCRYILQYVLYTAFRYGDHSHNRML